MKNLRTRVSLSMVLLLAGCRSMHPGAVVIPVNTIAEAFDSDSLESRLITAYLSDGRVLEGTWEPVSSATPTEEVWLPTPTGKVTAQELAAPHYPAITATLGDTHFAMVCAFFGDFESHYRCRCGDDTGTLWLSRPVNIPGGPLNEILSPITVVLHQELH